MATPSAPGACRAPRRFERAVAALHDMGFKVRVGPQVLETGESAGSPRARAAEFNAFIRDPEVRAIMATIGGHTSNGMLPLIDYQALRDDPKIVVGYSDITALLLGCLTQARVVTFHGPTLMAEFGEYPSVLPYTRDGFLRALTRPDPVGRIDHPEQWTEEFLLWESDDSRPRRLTPGEPWTWLAEGRGVGPLIGGNLDTISALAGTSYLPSFHGAVLLLETCMASLARVEQLLTHLEMVGAMKDLAGMIVSRSFRAGAGFEQALKDHIRERFGERDFPIVAGVLLGHTDPMPTLPLGLRVVLDSRRALIEVCDAAVR